jgi:hypothetical protein
MANQRIHRLPHARKLTTNPNGMLLIQERMQKISS